MRCIVQEKNGALSVYRKLFERKRIYCKHFVRRIGVCVTGGIKLATRFITGVIILFQCSAVSFLVVSSCVPCRIYARLSPTRVIEAKQFFENGTLTCRKE